MFQYILGVKGMQCTMCEAHINDTVRKAVPDAKKVASSHTKGQTSFLSEQEVDEAALRAAIGETGYEMVSFEKKNYEKKPGLFSFLHRA